MNNTFEPQDEALDAFRSLLPVPIRKMQVMPDGKTMRIGSMLSDRLAAELWLMARKIICDNRLPLRMEVKESKLEGYVFDRYLQIEFVGLFSELLCY